MAVVAAAIFVVVSCTNVDAVTTVAANDAATAAASAEGWCDEDDLKCDRSSLSANRDPNHSSADSEGRQEPFVSSTDPSIDARASEGEEDSASYEEEDGDDVDEEERLESEWTVLEYWKMLDCDRHYQRHPRPPMVDQATWFYLRGLYAGLMAAASASTPYSSLDEKDGGGTRSNSEAEASSALERSLVQRRRQRNLRLREMAVSQVSWNEQMSRKVGFQVPVEVRHTDGRGRGVFALEAIPEESLVSVGGDEARFLEAELYRTFVELVPAELQCDIIQFSYLDQEIIDGEELDVILVALNDEAFLNADWTDNGSEANVIGVEYYGDDEENVDEEAAARRRTGDSATSSHEGRRIEYVGRRDIAAGEELLLKYHNFLYDDGWGVFGL
jgi:hypothetical protein